MEKREVYPDEGAYNTVTCPTCGGRGYVTDGTSCRRCEGLGTVTVETLPGDDESGQEEN